MIPELQRAVSNIANPNLAEGYRSNVDASKMHLEKATLIFRGVPSAVAASLINGVITLLIAWNLVNQLVLGSWVMGVFALGLLRIGIWFYVRRQRPTLQIMSGFRRFNMIAMMLNGVLWGMLAPIFAVYGQIGHVYLPFILAGMTAATIVSAGACWRSVLAFNIPALLPMAATFLIWGGEGASLISVAIILYGIFTSVVAFQTNSMIQRAIFLRSKNSYLSQALEEKTDERSEASKRFQAMIESSKELTLIFSPEGRVTYASPASLEILGYKPEALTGKTTRELMHEDDLPQFRAIGEQVLSVLGDVRVMNHLCLLGKNGKFVPLSGRLTNFLYVPGIEGFVFSGYPQAGELGAKLHAAQ